MNELRSCQYKNSGQSNYSAWATQGGSFVMVWNAWQEGELHEFEEQSKAKARLGKALQYIEKIFSSKMPSNTIPERMIFCHCTW